MNQDIAAMREALAAGPTKTWRILPAEAGVPYLRIRGTKLGGQYKVANVHLPGHKDALPADIEESNANARFIAACEPERIKRLLDALEAAQKDAERYRRLRAKACKKTAHDIYGAGCQWSIGFFSDDANKPFDSAVDDTKDTP